MRNNIRIDIKKEQKLDENLKPIGKEGVSIYISCDSIISYLGDVETKEELEELIKPSNIINAMHENLSEDELEIIEDIWNNSKYYYIGDKVIEKEYKEEI